MLFEKIREVVCQVFGREESEITRETSFVDDLGADSLDVVELITALEDELDLKRIPEDVMKRITTVGSLADCIEELLSADASASPSADC